MRRARTHHQRGFVLIAIMGVMLLLVVYLATIHGAVTVTVAQSKVSADRQASAAASAAVLELALRPGAPSELTLPDGHKASVTRQALATTDTLWRTIKPLAPQPGDELLIIQWAAEAKAEAPAAPRFLVNTQGRRIGAIRLPQVAAP